MVTPRFYCAPKGFGASAKRRFYRRGVMHTKGRCSSRMETRPYQMGVAGNEGPGVMP